ncbi:hypothetical protein LCGC14_2684800 [marine sediment metagenome]|uniref:Uncharacterized protein n=1 Tax=marine sediment metagenome TaxID=412755 RepID=A0A0F8ZK89_9ZZZZ
MNPEDTPELLAPSRRKKPYKYKRQKQRPRIVNPQEKHLKVAKAYLEDKKTFAASMREGGYPEGQANKGPRYQFKVSALMREAFDRVFKQLCKKLERLDLSNERMALVARFTLLRTMLYGEEDRKGSTYAASLAGKIDGVNLFERDIQVGVLALQVPAEWADRYSLEEGKSDMERDLEHITNTRIDNAETAITPPSTSPEELPKEKSDEAGRQPQGSEEK